jgi:hypothetical protein
VRRSGAKPRRQPARPAVEDLGPRRLAQFFGKELCSIRETIAPGQQVSGPIAPLAGGRGSNLSDH